MEALLPALSQAPSELEQALPSPDDSAATGHAQLLAVKVRAALAFLHPPLSLHAPAGEAGAHHCQDL